MSEWRKVRLGNVCLKIGSGATPKGGATVYVDSGVSLIRSQNVYNLEFYYSGLSHIDDKAAKNLEGVTIEKGDILLNITGDSVARTCVVPDNVLPARVNQHVSIIRPNSAVLFNRFLSYYLASPYMQSLMLGLAVGKGASRNAMTKDMISDFEVPCPPLPTQRRIAGILSAYDDLIENNRKQIKLLEEAARRLYKEWFVDLRFPGYEKTKMVDGLPEGWSRKTIESIAEYLNGYAFKPSDWGTKGKPIIKIKELNDGITKETPRNIGDNIPLKYLIKAGDIVFSWSATLTAKIWDEEEGLLNQHLFKVIPNSGVCREFVLQAILYALEEFQNLTTGATMKHIQRGKLEQVYVNVPNMNIMEQYQKIADEIRNDILCMKKQILLLQEARDRLLPKLMSGELEVG